MVRLIDGDALRDALGITGTKESCKGCKYNKQWFACNTDEAPQFSYVCEQIDEQPTVDAIPVEWLTAKISEHNSDGFAWMFEAVRDVWRKEHETD